MLFPRRKAVSGRAVTEPVFNEDDLSTHAETHSVLWKCKHDSHTHSHTHARKQQIHSAEASMIDQSSAACPHAATDAGRPCSRNSGSRPAPVGWSMHAAGCVRVCVSACVVRAGCRVRSEEPASRGQPHDNKQYDAISLRAPSVARWSQSLVMSSTSPSPGPPSVREMSWTMATVCECVTRVA
jgi:hypothetical protein